MNRPKIILSKEEEAELLKMMQEMADGSYTPVAVSDIAAMHYGRGVDENPEPQTGLENPFVKTLLSLRDLYSNCVVSEEEKKGFKVGDVLVVDMDEEKDVKVELSFIADPSSEILRLTPASPIGHAIHNAELGVPTSYKDAEGNTVELIVHTKLEKVTVQSIDFN